MDSIVIALPKIEDARKLRTVLERHGLSVAAVSSSASGVLSHLSELGSGILLCGFRLPDMNYMELIDCMPSDFDMLLLASARILCETPESVMGLAMPAKASDLVNTVHMLLVQRERRRKKNKRKPPKRTWKEQNYISNAKMILMQRNCMSEEEAYRYIQKCSMDSGTNMAETAQMILMLFFEE